MGGAPARPLRDLRAGPASAWGKGLGCADDSDARSCAARGPVQPRSGAAARIRIGPARAPRQGRDLFRARIPSHSFRIGCVWGGGEFCRTHPPPPPPPPCIGDKGPGAGRRSAKGPAPRAPSLNIRVTSLARQFSPLPQHASPLRAACGPPPTAAVCRNRRDRAASQRKPSPPKPGPASSLGRARSKRARALVGSERSRPSLHSEPTGPQASSGPVRRRHFLPSLQSVRPPARPPRPARPGRPPWPPARR